MDTSDVDAVRKALRPNTKMIYVETPTNPTMIITDIAAIAAIANEHKLTLAVDNTFLSPYLQQPIELGAHIVVHSMTKYLNGHSDCTGGALVLTRADGRRENLLFAALDWGGPGADGLLFGVARHQDAGRAHEAARRQRHGDRAVPGGPSQGEARALSGTAVSSAARYRAEAAARIWRHDFLRRGYAGGGADAAESCEAVFAGGKPGRSGNVDLAPGDA